MEGDTELQTFSQVNMPIKFLQAYSGISLIEERNCSQQLGCLICWIDHNTIYSLCSMVSNSWTLPGQEVGKVFRSGLPLSLWTMSGPAQE